MTSTEQLTQARAKLSEAFELLEPVHGLEDLDFGAVVQLRVEVSETIHRLSSLIVFASIGTKP